MWLGSAGTATAHYLPTTKINCATKLDKSLTKSTTKSTRSDTVRASLLSRTAPAVCLHPHPSPRRALPDPHPTPSHIQVPSAGGTKGAATVGSHRPISPLVCSPFHRCKGFAAGIFALRYVLAQKIHFLRVVLCVRPLAQGVSFDTRSEYMVNTRTFPKLLAPQNGLNYCCGANTKTEGLRQWGTRRGSVLASLRRHHRPPSIWHRGCGHTKVCPIPTDKR